MGLLESSIKVLPPAFANDPDRLARFEREAQLLASLNHPNIGAIYGLEAKALILELVDGPTLADRIAQGPLPLDEALPIARQIAEALEAAHEQGVVHRDLKPANIKRRPCRREIAPRHRFSCRRRRPSPGRRYANLQTDHRLVPRRQTASAGGGTKPRWRRDGGELFCVAGSNMLMSVTVKPGSGFVQGVPKRLFDIDLVGSDGWDYAVSDDGQRFLAMRYSGAAEGSVSVISGWPRALKR